MLRKTTFLLALVIFLGVAFILITSATPSTPTVSRILWIADCDPRTDEQHCHQGDDLDSFAPFYQAIEEVPAILEYDNPASLEQFTEYDIVIANFCSDVIEGSTVEALADYIDNGGAVVVMGDNTCLAGPKQPQPMAATAANELTQRYGIRFTQDDTREVQYAATVVKHPITQDVDTIAFFRNTYLQIIPAITPILNIHDEPVVAVYKGKGKVVAIASVSFQYDWIRYFPETDWSNNFILWKNILTWLK
jgi:uncharacterized membrane protein